MQKCRFTVTTLADGNETSKSGKGELTLSLTSARLEYSEADTQTIVSLADFSVTLLRRGAYSISIPLIRGERTDGSIGIAALDGDVKVYTHTLQYRVTEDSFLLLAKYDLIFGREIQKMQLRVYAKTLKTEEEK